MNWKLLSITLMGLTLVACEGKKEEKKADEAATTSEPMKVEEPKTAPAEATPAPAEAVAPTEMPKEEPKEEKKPS